MDNGAYGKYKQENPDVYTPLSTYDYLDLFVQEMSLTDWALCAIALALALYEIFKIFFKRKNKQHDDHDV